MAKGPLRNWNRTPRENAAALEHFDKTHSGVNVNYQHPCFACCIYSINLNGVQSWWEHKTRASDGTLLINHKAIGLAQTWAPNSSSVAQSIHAVGGWARRADSIIEALLVTSADGFNYAALFTSASTRSGKRLRSALVSCDSLISRPFCDIVRLAIHPSRCPQLNQRRRKSWQDFSSIKKVVIFHWYPWLK